MKYSQAERTAQVLYEVETMISGQTKTIHGSKVYLYDDGDFAVQTPDDSTRLYASAKNVTSVVRTGKHRQFAPPAPAPPKPPRMSASQKSAFATKVALAAATAATTDEEKKLIAHWLHHLPVDRAARLAVLPAPVRSNWR